MCYTAVAGKSGTGNVHFTVDAKGQVKLGDLIVFHQGGIEVTLAVKFAEFGDGASGEQTGFDRRMDRFLIGYRQHTGVAHADRTDIGIGFSTEFIGARTEHFAGRANLSMHFQTDNSFVFHTIHPLGLIFNFDIYL